MTRNKQPVGWGTFPSAMATALNWRLLLAWLIVMAIPTVLVALPVGQALSRLLDHSPHADSLAHGFDGLLMGDALYSMLHHNAALAIMPRVALVVTVFLSPFVTGMVIALMRARQRPGFGALMHGGLTQYWRMLRIMLWALIPYGIAVVLGFLAFRWASSGAEDAVLQSTADRGYLIAKIVLVVLLVLAHVVVESTRAQVAADVHLRSATRALGRGVMTTIRRPLATLGLYLATSIVGYVLVGLVGMWRMRVDAIGLGGWLLAVVLAQVIVLLLAWQRTARIAALSRVAQTTHRRRDSFAPAG